MGSFFESATSSSTLSERIFGKLCKEILAGRLKPGARLPPEEEIAKTFNASVPTVRGTLRQLVSQGLIYSKRGPQGGYFVDRPDVEKTEKNAGNAIDWLVRAGGVSAPDVLEAYQMVCITCGQFAAQRRSDTDLYRIEHAVIKMSDSSLSNELFCKSETQVSQLIAQASGNPLLKLLHFLTSCAFSAAMRDKVFDFEERQTLVAIRRAIVSAIRARQTEIADARIIDLFECYKNAMASVDLRHAFMRPALVETKALGR